MFKIMEEQTGGTSKLFKLFVQVIRCIFLGVADTFSPEVFWNRFLPIICPGILSAAKIMYFLSWKPYTYFDRL